MINENAGLSKDRLPFLIVDLTPHCRITTVEGSEVYSDEDGTTSHAPLRATTIIQDTLHLITEDGTIIGRHAS